ncbi:hypothetical protein MLD38_002801 [Melastoma candidum]|uniref:Uncharacterized protein n=1 Tax=Melastoma candidum TaxID=119954 RepID=A0ACB9S930_9MYRT|nr:hypothetical protein MLD38_002801 [Melastoma candidum]
MSNTIFNNLVCQSSLCPPLVSENQSILGSFSIPANTLFHSASANQPAPGLRKPNFSSSFLGKSIINLRKMKQPIGKGYAYSFTAKAVLATDSAPELQGMFYLEGDIELKVPLTIVLLLAFLSAMEIVSSKSVFKCISGQCHGLTAPNPSSVTQVEIQVNATADSLILHWGALCSGKEKWILPSRHPDGTEVYKNRALRTPFVKEEYEAARLELLEEIARGKSIEELRQKLLNRNERKGETSTSPAPVSRDKIPEELVQIQAYIRWEKAGKPNYSIEKQQMEFEEARKDLQAELKKGLTLEDIRKKICKGEVASKVSKQLSGKKYFRVERIQRKQRDIMQLITTARSKPVVEATTVEPKTLTAVELFAKAMEQQDGNTTIRKTFYKLNNKQLLVLVSKPADKLKIHITTDYGEPVTLHWALSQKRGGEWLEPPSTSIPAGSISQTGATETTFSSISSLNPFYQVQGVEIELKDGGYIGMPFVLHAGSSWIKNKGSDFYIEFNAASKKIYKDIGNGKGTAKSLLEKIASMEGEAQKSFMHRFNIAADLIDQAKDVGEFGLAGILVWMRFMATRQLIWNKNYNVKPREISRAQDRLTDLLQNVYAGNSHLRELTRMIMSTVGRGGEGDVGQRIRDEILVIQRNNNCKGGMMEEWHQKLHNNTSPDDVVICQALIEYINSDFDIGVYWKTLNDNGITKERLLSYDRAIHSEPNFSANQKEGLLRDLGNYMRTLKAVHSGADLETLYLRLYSLQGVGFMVGVDINPIPGLPSGFPELLEFVLEHVEDKHVEPLLEGLLEARQELRSLLLKSSDRLKDLLFLDIALDSTVRTAIERGYEELNKAGPDKLIYLILLVLENLALSSDDNEDLIYGLKEWRHAAKNLKSGSHKWALNAKSVLDRTRLALANKAESYQKILQPSAEYLGSLLGVDRWAVNIFTEEIIRSGSAASLSSLLNRLDPVLRKTANLGSWQVISPCEVIGRIVVANELLAVQNKSYGEPTILVAKSVKGEEEIPDGAVAVLTPDMPDVLSHVSVRARNSKVCFATCFDQNILSNLEANEGKYFRLKPSSTGIVYSEVKREEVTDGSSSESKLVEKLPSLTLSKKKFSGRYAIPSADFNNEMVGAKSRNIAYLKNKVPSWIGVPTSVAIPFGVFEKVLSERINERVSQKLQTMKKKLAEEDFGALNDIRDMVMQLRAPDELVLELKSVMQSSGMPWPDDEGEYRWEQAWMAIKKVWASKWNERAYFSTRKIKLDHEYLCMAVLVQEIINANYAFVIHTTNPSSGDSSEIYAEVVRGLGETLVGAYPGRALSFVSKKSDLNSPQLLGYPSKPIGLFIRKSIFFRSDSNGEDLEGYAGAGLYDSVAMDEEEKVVLDYTSDPLVVDENFQNSILSRIAKAGSVIEELYGSPQDIEGVVKDGKIYIVQTRPRM